MSNAQRNRTVESACAHLAKQKMLCELKFIYGFDMLLFLNRATKDSYLRTMFKHVTANLC